MEDIKEAIKTVRAVSITRGIGKAKDKGPSICLMAIYN